MLDLALDNLQNGIHVYIMCVKENPLKVCFIFLDFIPRMSKLSPESVLLNRIAFTIICTFCKIFFNRRHSGMISLTSFVSQLRA